MRIAIPVADGLLAQHFGHCAKFAFIVVNASTREVVSSTETAAPAHEPGLLPRWLQERGANVVIAGGMGSHARALFQEAGIEVVTGAENRPPDAIVRDYLAGSLATRANSCDH